MTGESELSERELEILRLVATGASNKEIAQALVISPNTVKVHLRNIFAKINAASRTEATVFAIRSGLVPSPAGESAPEGELNSLEAASPVEAPPRPALSRPALALLLLAVVLLIGGSYWGGRVFSANRAAAEADQNPQFQRWTVFAPLDAPRSGMAAARFERSIYLFGGEGNRGVSGQASQYQPLIDTWEILPEKPTPVRDAQAAVVAEKIYIPGGETDSGRPTDVFEVFDPRQKEWSSAAPLPVALSGYSLAAFEGSLYLFGGWDGSQFVDTVYAYDPLEDRWTERARMDAPGGFSAAVTVGEGIYLFGGTDGKTADDRAQVFYPNRAAGESWRELTPMPAPRYGMAAAMLADQIFLFGGQRSPSDRTAPPPLQYQPQLDQWLQVDAPLEPLGSELSMIPFETHLHVFGGISSGKLQDRHQSYQAIYIVPLPLISESSD